MAKAKFKLTNDTTTWCGRTLFRIEAVVSFGNVEKGEKGGYVEKEDNLSHDGDAWVSGDAQVYGNAWVYGDAQVYGASLNSKKAFTKGRFVDRNDGSELKLTVLHKEACLNWDNTYVLGDYEITDIEPEPAKETIVIGGVTYDKNEVEAKLKDIKPVK